MSAGSSKIPFFFWHICAAVLLVLFLIITWLTYSAFNKKLENQLEQGSAFFVNVDNDKITAAEKVVKTLEIGSVKESDNNNHKTNTASQLDHTVSKKDELETAEKSLEELQDELVTKEDNKAEVKEVAAAARPKIAIIIKGLALSKTSTHAAMDLPKQVTFSFSPYAHNLQAWINDARLKGHEILLDFPLEPEDFPITDPGPYALISSLSKEENIKRFDSLLGIAQGYTGFLAPAGEKFTDSPTQIAPIISRLREKNINLIMTEGDIKNPIYPLSVTMNYRFRVSEVVIDEVAGRAEIEKKLAELEKIALLEGEAIAIARPYPITIEILLNWQKILDSKGIELVSVSETKPEEIRL